MSCVPRQKLAAVTNDVYKSGLKRCLGCPRHRPWIDSTQHLHLAAPGGRRGQARPPPLPPPGHGSDGATCCPPDPANGGVRRFQHLIMQTLPRSVWNFFLQRRDEAIRVTLESILHLAPDTLRRHAETRARMPHLLGGRQCAKGSAPSAMQPLWQPMPSPVNHLSKSGYREESILTSSDSSAVMHNTMPGMPAMS